MLILIAIYLAMFLWRLLHLAFDAHHRGRNA